MQPKDYSVEEQVRKTPSHISILSLLMSSEAHRNALMEVLNGVNIPKETTTKMVASKMLKYGYQPKSGLGPKSNGIVEPI
ncbi:hypothetical protein R3W88_004360 [Solanum pinnatisectum]|uniref:G-patch domain-containing protein n=1 Tax=Solanum pinnatisectum TaxID=50273 RepID=A0AAV9K9C8_9SOLN|nr:hypothetical protein R3W88_004360 [Solanum pinnatisectum]